jgi:hypothetical protein
MVLSPLFPLFSKSTNGNRAHVSNENVHTSHVGKMKNRKSNSEMMAGTAVAYISIQIKKKTTRRLLEIALASSIIRGGVVC